MNSNEKFKGMIHRGEIAMPKDIGELITVLDRFRTATAYDGDIDKEVQKHKDFFMSVLESQCKIDSKETPTDWAWLSNIKRRTLKSSKNKLLDLAVQAFYGDELIRVVIKSLVVESKIKVNGNAKKIFPMAQFENR